MPDRYDHDLLLDYLEGELNDEQRAQVDALIQADPKLGSLLRGMAGDRDLLRSLPEEAAPPDLLQDLNAPLEREMLLDAAPEESGPIPISRGRAITAEQQQSMGWGRVIGLTGLAASVALVAGLIVYTMNPNDPLNRTANEFAQSPPNGDPAKPVGTPGTPGIEDSDNALKARIAGTNFKRLPLFGMLGSDDKSHLPDKSPEGDAIAKADVEPVDPRQLLLEKTGNRAATFATVQEDPGQAPTRALAVVPQRQQVVLLTDSVTLTREQLVELCIDNGITIVQAEAASVTTPRPADYALLITQDKLNALVDTLNSKPNRAANEDAAVQIESPAQVAIVTASEAKALTAGAEDGTNDTDPTPDPQGKNPQGDPADDSTAAKSARPGVRQAEPIQPLRLRLADDLGSPYHNARNLQNYRAEQRHNALPLDLDQDADLKDKSKDSVDEPGVTPDAKPNHADGAGATPKAVLEEKADPKPDPKSSPIDNDKSSDDRTPNKSADEQDEENSQTNKETEAKEEADREGQPEEQRARGNWLSPHLPGAGTTALNELDREANTSVPLLVTVVLKQADRADVLSNRTKQGIPAGDTAEAEEEGASPTPVEPSKPDPAGDDAEAPAEDAGN